MKILNKILKFIFILACIQVIFFNFSYAADTDGGRLGDMVFVIESLTKILATIWIVPAIIAGKLLSNEFVYGEIFHLTGYLWQLWNIMKNFANYTLGFLFLVMILKSFYSGESTTIFKALPKMLAASVLIQASWFIIAALIDISNIATAAVGSFPSSFFEGNIKIKTNYTIPEKVAFISKDSEYVVEISGSKTLTGLDSIIGKYNNLSGPFLFLGNAILRVHDYSFINSKNFTLKSLTFANIVQIIIIIMFTAPIVILVIVNMMRIFYIWMIIVFSPFIILFHFFKGDLKGIEEAGNKPYFQLGNILGLIFQPVAVTGCLGIALIFIITLSNLFTGDMSNNGSGKINIADNTSISYKGAEGTESQTSTIDADGGSFILVGHFFQQSGDILGGALGYLIVTFFSIFLIWTLLKVGFQTSDITNKFVEGSFGYLEGLAKAAPIFGGKYGIGAAMKAPERLKQSWDRKMSSKQDEQVKNIEKALGMSNTKFRDHDALTIKQELTSSGAQNYIKAQIYFKKLNEIFQEDADYTINDDVLQGTIKEWIEIGGGKQILQMFDGKFDENYFKSNNINQIVKDEVFLKFFQNALKNPEGIQQANCNSLKNTAFLGQLKNKQMKERVK